MSIYYKLNKKLATMYEQLRGPLADRIYELRSQYDNASEGWQESDRGTAVSEWLDAGEEVVQAMENFETGPEG